MKNENGLTLVETLVGIVLAGILLLIIANVFSLNLDLNRGELQVYEARQTQANLYDEIRDAVRYAKSITVSDNGKKINIDNKELQIRPDGLYRDGDKVIDAKITNPSTAPFIYADGKVIVNFQITYGKVNTNLFLSVYKRGT